MVMLKNTNKKEHAVYFAGYEYRVPRGKTVDIPGRIAFEMQRRFPSLVEVDRDGNDKGHEAKYKRKTKKEEAPVATAQEAATPEAKSGGEEWQTQDSDQST